MASNGEKKESQTSATINYGGQTVNIDMQNPYGADNSNHNGSGIIGAGGEILMQGEQTVAPAITNATATTAITPMATSSTDYSGNECIVGGNLTPANTVKFTINQIDFQNIKAASDTLKRNPKIEFSRSDLLKLLSYLEGELQARDVVIAALKSEKVKQLLHTTRYKPLSLNDPHAALFRDNLATSGNIASRQSSTAAAQTEQEMRLLADQQMESLENLIMQQRQTQMRMVTVLRDAEDKHKRLMQELEEEKRKHERDTAQGDDITYGLEMERTRLKQELELEKTNKKKYDKELKKQQEMLENERGRQKQIVLLLLAERKKIIMKYIEERKRSEDLAQILSEEKQRVDTIAEGLEEESKKSLRMEEELEKQMYQFENERKLMKINLAKEEKRVKDQEIELLQLKTENDMLRKQVANLPPRLLGTHPPVPQLPTKTNVASSVRSSAGVTTGNLKTLDESGAASPMMSSVAKVVQPTATVTSVPVSGPTTGIARSISPGQSLRQTPISDVTNFNTTKARKLQNSTTGSTLVSSGSSNINQSTGGGGISNSGISGNPCITSGATSGNNNDSGGTITGSGVTQGISAIPNTLSKMSAAAAAVGVTSPPPPPTQTLKKLNATQLGRGVPPPIPPNKPVVPPKREPNVSRLSSGVYTAQVSVGGINVASPSPPTVTAIVPPGATTVVSAVVASTQGGIPTTNKNKDLTSSTTTTSNIVAGTNSPQLVTTITGSDGSSGGEMLDEEIQDFQQVLCSMVNK